MRWLYHSGQVLLLRVQLHEWLAVRGELGLAQVQQLQPPRLPPVPGVSGQPAQRAYVRRVELTLYRDVLAGVQREFLRQLLQCAGLLHFHYGLSVEGEAARHHDEK